MMSKLLLIRGNSKTRVSLLNCGSSIMKMFNPLGNRVEDNKYIVSKIV